MRISAFFWYTLISGMLVTRGCGDIFEFPNARLEILFGSEVFWFMSVIQVIQPSGITKDSYIKSLSYKKLYNRLFIILDNVIMNKRWTKIVWVQT